MDDSNAKMVKSCGHYPLPVLPVQGVYVGGSGGSAVAVGDLSSEYPAFVTRGRGGGRRGAGAGACMRVFVLCPGFRMEKIVVDPSSGGGGSS